MTVDQSPAVPSLGTPASSAASAAGLPPEAEGHGLAVPDDTAGAHPQLVAAVMAAGAAHSRRRSASGALPLGWREALLSAARVVRDRPALIGVGLLGFLARGGLLLFLVPILILPTPTGISNFIGGNALTGSGASDGLIRLLALAVTLVALAIAAGAVLGAIADVLLARDAVEVSVTRARRIVSDPARNAVRREVLAATAITPGLLGRVLAVRVVTQVPVAIAGAWAAVRLVAAGYDQLVAPVDVTLPLTIRILSEALEAVLVLVAVWLFAEFVGGIAARLVIVEDRSPGAAIGMAVVAVIRRPVTGIASYALGVAGLAVAAGVPLLVAMALWDRLQVLSADDVAIPLLVAATFLFVAAWGAGLLAVGIVTAWRSVLGTLDVVRRAPVPSSIRARIVADPSGGPMTGPEVALQEG
jgi:hypothetical protein